MLPSIFPYQHFVYRICNFFNNKSSTQGNKHTRKSKNNIIMACSKLPKGLKIHPFKPIKPSRVVSNSNMLKFSHIFIPNSLNHYTHTLSLTKIVSHMIMIMIRSQKKKKKRSLTSSNSIQFELLRAYKFKPKNDNSDQSKKT